jgi:hypothetical protein
MTVLGNRDFKQRRRKHAREMRKGTDALGLAVQSQVYERDGS